jgi:hypothetical protein
MSAQTALLNLGVQVIAVDFGDGNLVALPLTGFLPNW